VYSHWQNVQHKSSATSITPEASLQGKQLPLPAQDKALELKQLVSLPTKVPELLSLTLMLVRSFIRVCELIADCWKVKAQQVAEKINSSGGKAVAVPGDMLDAE